MNWMQTDKHIESGHTIIDEVIKLCNCHPEAYKNATLSTQNLQLFINKNYSNNICRLISELPNPKETKFFQAIGLNKNQNLIYSIISQKILPILQKKNKINNFYNESPE